MTILHTGVNGVVPSEAVVVESEVMKSQTQQMKEFSRGMRKCVAVSLWWCFQVSSKRHRTVRRVAICVGECCM